jgi:hypothetical protein
LRLRNPHLRAETNGNKLPVVTNGDLVGDAAGSVTFVP